MTDNWDVPTEPPVGARVKLIEMGDDPDPVQAGTEGTVTGHGMGQVWVRWDDGRTLNLIPAIDKWEVLP